MLVAAAPAIAREDRRSPPGNFTGERVTVKTEAPKQSLRGRLVSFNLATLTIELPKDSPGGGSAGTA